MKKTILLITLIGLFISSCSVANPEQPSRTAQNLKWITGMLVPCSIIHPAEAINNCMLASEFLNASEERRKEPLFSTISYNPRTNTLIVAETDTIKTYGKDLFTVNTEWTLNRSIEGRFVVKCIGENQWAVTCQYDSDFVFKGVDAVPTFTLADRTADGLCNWKCNCSGKFKENDTYSATFHTENDLDIKWGSQFYGTYSASSQEITGVFSATYYIDGKEMDNCTLTFEDGEIKKAVTSQD